MKTSCSLTAHRHEDDSAAKNSPTEMISDAKESFLDNNKTIFPCRKSFSSQKNFFFLTARKKSCGKKKSSPYQEKYSPHQKTFLSDNFYLKTLG